MKIAYFGLPLGALLLKLRGFELATAVLSPLSAPGRRRLTRSATTTKIIDALSSPQALEPGAEVERTLLGVRPELLLSWFWTRRLPAEWLASATLGAYGVHPSLLPKHRGPNPYFAAIDAGDVVTGATLHELTPEYDTGPLHAIRTVEVGDRNAWQLARAIDRPSLELLVRAAERARAGSLGAGRPQQHSLANWAGEPTGDQLRVDWNWRSERILRRIRALSPVPGLAIEVRGTKFFVIQASPSARPILQLAPGEAQITDSGLIICTGDAAITVTKAILCDRDVCIDKYELASLLAERQPHLHPAHREKPRAGGA